MKISEREQTAIREVLRYGAEFGFGNLIAHLQTRWAETLIDSNCNLDEETARHHAGPGYPFQMQRDLLLRGEWDETGQRYQGAL